MMRRLIAISLILMLSVPILPVRSIAAEATLEVALKDAAYGGIIGALVGAALMVFTDEPDEHLNYIAYGAAAGVIGGTAIGLASSTRALAEMEDGKLTFHAPEIKTDLLKDKRDEKVELVRTVYLFRFNF